MQSVFPSGRVREKAIEPMVYKKACAPFFFKRRAGTCYLNYIMFSPGCKEKGRRALDDLQCILIGQSGERPSGQRLIPKGSGSNIIPQGQVSSAFPPA